ncbi:MAG: tetratricopeptide repeat protein [Elusimicrobia bacterium]|nr:tetratricopeptide repeat protein [Elusimicrobiota bacterium]
MNDKTPFRGRTSLLAYAGLAVWALWSLKKAFVGFALAPAAYAEGGEVLRHGLHHFPANPSGRLPMGMLMDALGTSYGPEIGLRLQESAFAAIVALVFALGCLLGPAWVGLLSLASYANWFRSTELYTATHAITFLLVACALVWRAARPSLARSLFLALALGASLLSRSTLALFPPLLVVYERLSRRQRLKGPWRHWLLLLIIPYLFIAPWARMNWALFHRFIPFENGGGDLILVTGAMGVVEGSDGDVHTLIDFDLHDPQQSLLGWAVREAARHPLRYARAYCARLVFVLRLFPWWLLLALTALWLHRDREDFRQLGLIGSYLIGIHCLLSIADRYFVPLQPILVCLAASIAIRASPRAIPAVERWSYRASEWLIKAGLAVTLALALWSEVLALSYTEGVGARLSSSSDEVEEALRRHPRDRWLQFHRDKALLKSETVQDYCKEWVPGAKIGGPREIPADHYCEAWRQLRLGHRSRARSDLEFVMERCRQSAFIRNSRDPYEKQIEARLKRGSLGMCLQSLRDSYYYLPPHAHSGLIQELSRMFPRESAILLELARSSAETGDGALALDSLARAEALDMGVNEKRFMAMLAVRLGAYPLALRVLKPLTTTQPRDMRLWLAQAQAALESGDRPTALDSLRRAWSLIPAGARDPDLWLELAKLAVGLDQSRLALEAMERAQALETRPEGKRRLAELWLAHAKSSLAAGDRPRFTLDLERARGLTADQDTLQKVAMAYQEAGEPDRGRSILVELVRNHPQDAGLLKDLGISQHLCRDSDAAIASLEAAISLDPKKVEAYLSLGAVLVSRRRSAEAVELYDRALAHAGKGDAALRRQILQRRREALAAPGQSQIKR